MSSISFVLFGSNKITAADFTLDSIRKYHPDNYCMIISDNGENYYNLSKKYDAEFFLTESKIGYPQQPYGWKRDAIIDFLERFYIACFRCKTSHIMYVEEDVVLLNKVNVEDDLEISGFKTCWPDGRRFENGFPDEFLKIIQDFSGVYPNVTSYGAQGGTIMKVDTFLDNFHRIKDFIHNNIDHIQENIYPTAGWLDCFLTWYYLLCGKKYTFNPLALEVNSDFIPNKAPNWAVLAHGYKWFYDKKTFEKIENTHLHTTLLARN